MSLICLCVINVNEKTDLHMFRGLITETAKKHGVGVSFSVNWIEPVIMMLPKSAFVVSLTTGPCDDTCEMLLLPDGWTYNGNVNGVPFNKRMLFFKNLTKEAFENGCAVEFYIGPSGLLPNEYLEVNVNANNIIKALNSTIGQDGAETGVHIIVCE